MYVMWEKTIFFSFSFLLKQFILKNQSKIHLYIFFNKKKNPKLLSQRKNLNDLFKEEKTFVLYYNLREGHFGIQNLRLTSTIFFFKNFD